MQQKMQMGPMCSNLLPVLQHSTQHKAACHPHVGMHGGQPADAAFCSSSFCNSSQQLSVPASSIWVGFLLPGPT